VASRAAVVQGERPQVATTGVHVVEAKYTAGRDGRNPGNFRPRKEAEIRNPDGSEASWGSRAAVR
jgi:hypothetical protein